MEFCSGTRPAVEDVHGELSHADITADVFGLRARVPYGGTAAVVGRTARLVACSVAALDGWAAAVHLIGDSEAAPAGAVVLGDDAVLSTVPLSTAPGPDVHRDRPDTGWLLVTSGTTGTPKGVTHRLESLTRTARKRPGRATRWGLLYSPTRMAGVQVILQALVDGGILLDPTHLSSFPERLAWLAERDVDALSGTPSMWRQILQSSAKDALHLEQVTLGGEIVDQLTLDALHSRFPDARITHVFASTESGAAFSVGDGREGFPLSYLTDPPNGIRLEIRTDVLHIHAPKTDVADQDGFVATGDVVEVRGDRVLFHGRSSGVVNVGGVKVWPEQVETTLRSHPEVLDIVVVPRRNPLSGWILTASVVPARDAEVDTLPARLRVYCTERMSAAHVPAVVRMTPSLVLGDSGKAGRR